jgi:NADPH:quinone reductase-like Zn-dependent oxidoreductase
MGMAAVIYEKGAPDNFVWEEIKVGTPGRGEVGLRSTAVGVNFADTYHRAGIAHPMIVGDPPVVLGFEGVGEIEESGPGVTGFAVGERVCTCLPPLFEGQHSAARLGPKTSTSKPSNGLDLEYVGGRLVRDGNWVQQALPIVGIVDAPPLAPKPTAQTDAQLCFSEAMGVCRRAAQLLNGLVPERLLEACGPQGARARGKLEMFLGQVNSLERAAALAAENAKAALGPVRHSPEFD